MGIKDAIVAWYVGVEKTLTVDVVLAQFTEMVNNLEKIVSSHQDSIKSQEDVIKEATRIRQESMTEIDRAVTAIDKLKEFTRI